VSGRPVRTVFLGSGGFAVPVLAVVAERPDLELAAVVTAPPRPVGRRQAITPTPVGAWAAERGLPIMSPSRLRDEASVAALRELAPGLLVLADYGQIVPKSVLDLPRHGALNLHPSLLPRHRGAAPIQATILAGDEQAGVTLMVMDAGLDSGPIVAQRAEPLTGRESAPELERRLAQLAARLLDEALRPWLDGRLAARPQSTDGVTMTRPLRRDDGRLDPHRPVSELERQVRALQPWPGTFVETPAGRLAVRAAQLSDDAASDRGELVGLVGLSGGRLGLATTDGVLELLEVQPPGGRPMTGAELLRGRPGLLTVG